MKNRYKIILLIFISFFLITCTKKDRIFYFKSEEFRNIIGRWELQSIFTNGIDSTKQFMADSTLADGWLFDFIINDKKNEVRSEGYFLAYKNYKRTDRITKYGSNCWYLTEKDTKLIVKFILEKIEYEKLWQQNNKEVIFNIVFLSDTYMILNFEDLNNRIYQLNFIKRNGE